MHMHSYKETAMLRIEPISTGCAPALPGRRRAKSPLGFVAAHTGLGLELRIVDVDYCRLEGSGL